MSFIFPFPPPRILTFPLWQIRCLLSPRQTTRVITPRLFLLLGPTLCKYQTTMFPPPYHHVRTRKSPSQYRCTRNIPIYTKHTSSKKTSSARQHAASVKSNPVHVRSSVPVVNWSPLSYRYSIHRSSPTITVLAYSMPVPRQRDPLLLDQTALKNATLLQD